MYTVAYKSFKIKIDPPKKLHFSVWEDRRLELAHGEWRGQLCSDGGGEIWDISGIPAQLETIEPDSDG